MIRIVCWRKPGAGREELPEEELAAVLADAKAVIWVDIQGGEADQIEEFLNHNFQFHPLAIDDAIVESHLPKLDNWINYLYIVLHGIDVETYSVGSKVETLELDVFLGNNYLVTYHEIPLPAVDKIWDLVARDERQHLFGPDHLLYKIADELVSQLMPVFDKVDEVIDHVEDDIFKNPRPDALETMIEIKRNLLHLRRIIAPQREVINRLARDEYEVIDAKDQVFFRDVYDHLVRIYEISESLRELASGGLDTYMSIVNNRINNIMRALTVITTIFMPLSFVVGFFGMNFFAAPDPQVAWMSEAVFAITLIFLIAMPVGMFLWIRNHNWN